MSLLAIDEDHYIAGVGYGAGAYVFDKAKVGTRYLVIAIRTFVDPGNPTRVGVLMDVADMDAVMAAMETEAAAEAMAYDGVIPETLVLLVEA